MKLNEEDILDADLKMITQVMIEKPEEVCLKTKREEEYYEDEEN